MTLLKNRSYRRFIQSEKISTEQLHRWVDLARLILACLFRSIDKPKLNELIKIPGQYEIINVIALGKPLEIVVVDEMKNNDFKYWRDEHQIHHVPKRSLESLILKL